MEALHDTVPNNSRIRVPGCEAFVHKRKENWRETFKSRTETASTWVISMGCARCISTSHGE